jgi:hypothetical protein
MESGSPVGLLTLSEMITPETFVNLSKAMDCDGKDTQQRVTCLKKLSAEDLQNKYKEFVGNTHGIAYPTIDGKECCIH